MTNILLEGAASEPAPLRTEARTPHRVHDQLCFALYASAHAFARRYKPLLAPLGLTYPQYLCLLVLWDGDDITVSAIGAELQLDSGTLTPLLKRLEKAGLLQRKRDLKDERQVRIRLTEEGSALRSRAADVQDAIACATGLAAEEIASLRDRLIAVRLTLDTQAE